jgi:nucleoside-diphosphate-sugar epimerase
MRVLVVGCGYVGLPLGARLASEGHEVTGIRRSAGSETELRQAGIRPLLLDITRENAFWDLVPNYEWIINCVSSSRGDTEDYRSTYLQGTQRLVKWLNNSPLQKFLYTSSTSVYGQTDGSIVTEISPTEPAVETARILVETEKTLLEAFRQHLFPAVILRLAGIYGPNRGYWFRQFMSGKAEIENDGRRVLNLIHRDDVIGAVVAALKGAPPGEIYNVADDDPVTQMEFFSWLSKKVGRSLPPVSSQPAAKNRKRGSSNKRVSNFKLKTGLGYQLRYPTFREGYEQGGISNDK